MPRFDSPEDKPLATNRAGNFGFTAVNVAELGDISSKFTLATIVCDKSGSTSGFEDAMEAALKSSIEALKKHPESESIMVRVLTIDSECQEVHGFIPLPDIDPVRYAGSLAPGGMTALYDGCINGAEAAANYGRELMQERFNVNGILIVITDGANNSGRFDSDEGRTPGKDVDKVRDAFKMTTQRECLESFLTVLIGVNIQNAEISKILNMFHGEAGFTAPMIELNDASPKTIGKIGGFITASVSSTSQALGTGGPSQPIAF